MGSQFAILFFIFSVTGCLQVREKLGNLEKEIIFLMLGSGIFNLHSKVSFECISDNPLLYSLWCKITAGVTIIQQTNRVGIND